MLGRMANMQAIAEPCLGVRARWSPGPRNGHAPCAQQIFNTNMPGKRVRISQNASETSRHTHSPSYVRCVSGHGAHNCPLTYGYKCSICCLHYWPKSGLSMPHTDAWRASFRHTPLSCRGRSRSQQIQRRALPMVRATNILGICGASATRFFCTSLACGPHKISDLLVVLAAEGGGGDKA